MIDEFLKFGCFVIYKDFGQDPESFPNNLANMLEGDYKSPTLKLDGLTEKQRSRINSYVENWVLQRHFIVFESLSRPKAKNQNMPKEKIKGEFSIESFYPNP